MERSRPEIAEPFYRASIAILAAQFGADHPHALTASANQAQSLARQQRHAESGAVLERVLAGYESTLGPDHHRVAVAAHKLAQHLRVRKRYAEAELLYRKALAIWETSLGGAHPDLALGLKSFGDLFADQGKLHGAEALYLRALKIAESGGPDRPVGRAVLESLAALYLSAQRNTDYARARRRLDGIQAFR